MCFLGHHDKVWHVSNLRRIFYMSAASATSIQESEMFEDECTFWLGGGGGIDNNYYIHSILEMCLCLAHTNVSLNKEDP